MSEGRGGFLDHALRFEYRHRRTRRCGAKGWHDFCDAVDFLACTYQMRTVAREPRPAFIIAAAVLDDQWWPADGGKEALALGTKIEEQLRDAGLLN